MTTIPGPGSCSRRNCVAAEAHECRQEEAVEDQDRLERMPQLLGPEAPGDCVRDYERADDAEREPREEDDAGDEEVPAGMAPLGDRVHRRPRRRSAEAEVARGLLEPVAIAHVPEAEHCGEDEPQRHEPEEEPVGEAAREQPGRRHPLPLEQGGDMGCAGKLVRSFARVRRSASHPFDQGALDLGLGQAHGWPNRHAQSDACLTIRSSNAQPPSSPTGAPCSYPG